MVNQFIRKWDILIWEYMTIKIYLYKHSFRKLFDFFSLFIYLSQIVPDLRYKTIIEKYLQENPHFFYISSRKKLIEYMSELREHLNTFGILEFNLFKTIRNLDRFIQKNKMTAKNPKVWGRKLWLLLHLLSIPNKIDCELKKITLNKIIDSMPCSICRTHTKAYRKDHLLKNCELQEYMFRFHNHVNHRLGKKVINSFEKAMNNVKRELDKI